MVPAAESTDDSHYCPDRVLLCRHRAGRAVGEIE